MRSFHRTRDYNQFHKMFCGKTDSYNKINVRTRRMQNVLLICFCSMFSCHVITFSFTISLYVCFHYFILVIKLCWSCHVIYKIKLNNGTKQIAGFNLPWPHRGTQFDRNVYNNISCSFRSGAICWLVVDPGSDREDGNGSVQSN